VWVECPEVMSATVNSVPFYTAVDLDDANNPTAVSQVAGKQGAVVSMTGTGHYHAWKPHMAVAVYSGAFTSFSNAPAGWIDSGSTGVQHYGLKAAVNGADGQVHGYYALVRAKISFRAAGI